MHAQRGGGVRMQRGSNHFRSQIRTANADVNNIGNRFAAVTFPIARTNALTKPAHFFQRSVNLRHHILTIDKNGRVAAIA